MARKYVKKKGSERIYNEYANDEERKETRKIQNRINQQNHRLKKKLEQENKKNESKR